MGEQEPLIKVTNVSTKTKCRLPCRYVLAMLTFWGLSVTYSLRVNLSVALVAMVNSTYANANADSMENPECQDNTNNSTRSKDGEFKWDQETQGMILGSFFYGYIVTQIPGGWLTSRFGGKHLFGLGILSTSIFTIITPWVVRMRQGLVLFVALRVLEGLGEDGEFNWDQQTQGHILAAFFQGYLIPVTIGGWLSSKLGGKHLFGWGILSASLLTMTIPFVARQGVGYLIALRGLEGVAVGMAFPSINALWSQWAPPLERSRLLSFGFSGSRIGTILAMGVSGFLCDSDVMGGWPSVFYLFGAQGILWFIVWTIFIYEKPSDHPRISLDEKDYIETALGSAQYEEVNCTPWLAILTSVPVWAILITNFCTSWGFYIFLTLLPTYFQQVLNMNMSENGVLSALPSVSAYVMIMMSGIFADWLQTANILSTGETRKVLTFAGLVPAACLLVANSYVGCNDKAISVGIFTVAVGLTGMVSSGFMVSHLDIAPRYSGLIVGLSNTMGTVAGTIAPYITGWIINDRPTRAQWQKVFFLSAAIYILGAVVFLVFGSAKKQPWNAPLNRRTVCNHTSERVEIKG